MEISPYGACKDRNVFNINVISFDLVLDACIPVRLGSPFFFSLGSATLYADETQSPGRLQPSLVCQVVMSWSRLGGEWPEVR